MTSKLIKEEKQFSLTKKLMMKNIEKITYESSNAFDDKL